MSALTRQPADRILLRIDPTRRNDFLRMLKLFDFVEIEPLDKQVKQCMKNAPKNVSLTDDDIQQEINAVRQRRKER